MSEAPAPMDVNAAKTAEVAEVFALSVDAVQAWKAKIHESTGIWREVRGERGRGGRLLVWDLPRLIAWWRDQAVANAVVKVRPVQPLNPLEHEQLRKMQVQNGRAEEVIMDRLSRQWAQVGAKLRSKLETVGRRHGPAVSADITKAMGELKREVHGVLGPRA